MRSETMDRLGFLPTETSERPPRRADKKRRKEQDGYVPELTQSRPVLDRLSFGPIIGKWLSRQQFFKGGEREQREGRGKDAVAGT